MMRTYPVRFPAQLRQHLRALRKARGLSQAQLGALVGVSQARIAEIEANPGLVNFEQLMRLLAVLGVSVFLHEEPAQSAETSVRQTEGPAASAPRSPFVARPKKGAW